MTTWNDKLFPLVDRINPSNEDIIKGIKNWRNRELAASDWTQLADVQLANYGDWLEYRKQLRDMMAQNEDPKLIVFPEPPK